MNNRTFSRPTDRRYLTRAAWAEHEALVDGGKYGADSHPGIAATFTANNLLPLFGAALLERGLKPVIKLAPYNRLLQSCADPRSHLGEACDCAILLWRVEDLMLEQMAAYVDGDETALTAATGNLMRLLDAVARLRADFHGMIILAVPPVPVYGPGGMFSGPSPRSFHAAIAAHLRQRILELGDVRLLGMEEVQAEVGVVAACDWRQWYLYRQPFSEVFLLALAQRLGRMLAATRRPASKCIVLDADNTLWGGVVGEDGLDGIALGDEFPGSAYRDFQRQLLHLRNRGVLLAVASKNNEADVLEVFNHHQAMMLKRAHISAWAVHWGPKAGCISDIARQLNIASDSLVFLDDNPMEIAHMRQAHPEVASLRLPEEPAQLASFLQSVSLFDSWEITAEDRRRAEMLRTQEVRAQVAQNATGHEEFQRGLEVRVGLAPAQPDELGRVAQLTNKTNQFNLTTIRRSLEEIRALHRSPRHLLYTLRVSDRFGDYGLTGVVIVEQQTLKLWLIDTLLLSCRVLGRGVEAGLMAALKREALSHGVTQITARFLPTAKNMPAQDFLPGQGFRQMADKSWRMDIDPVGGEEPLQVAAQLQTVGS